MGKNLRKGMGLLLTMLLVLALALPAGAANDLAISVNGAEVAEPELIFENGLTVVSLSTLSKIVGADKVISQERFLLIDDNQLELPEAPVAVGENIYVPLRLVAEKLGYQVGWAEGRITLKSEPTKNGMTAMDVLVKSNQQAEAINTYTMQGSMAQQVNAQLDGTDEELAFDMDSAFSGQVQNEPLRLYMKQTVAMPAELSEETDADLAIETYMDEEFMYMKTPDQEGWLKQPHFMPMEILKEQQQINSDPLRAAAQMLDMGMAPVFAEDATIDGRAYYVIQTALDMKKMMDNQQDLMQQIIGAMGSQVNVGAAETEMITAVIGMVFEEIMNQGTFEMNYTAYIDQETFLPGLIKTDTVMDFDLDVMNLLTTVSEAIGEAIPVEELGEIPAQIQLKLIQQGEFTLADFGSEFIQPDLTKVMEPEDFFAEIPATKPSAQ